MHLYVVCHSTEPVISHKFYLIRICEYDLMWRHNHTADLHRVPFKWDIRYKKETPSKQRMIAISISRLDQQHLWSSTISGDQTRDTRSCGACTDHDEIIYLFRRQYVFQCHILHLIVMPLVNPFQSPQRNIKDNDTKDKSQLWRFQFRSH